MFGIIFGTICFIALMGVLRRRRWHRYAMMHHHGMPFGGFDGCGPGLHGPFGHHGPFGRGYRGFRGDGPLRFMFWQLQTTHGQEQVLRAEWENLKAALQEARGNFGGLARGASAAFASEQFDRASAEGLWQQHDAAMANVRTAIAQFMEKAHGVLDVQQRAQVARLFDRMHHARGFC